MWFQIKTVKYSLQAYILAMSVAAGMAGCGGGGTSGGDTSTSSSSGSSTTTGAGTSGSATGGDTTTGNSSTGAATGGSGTTTTGGSTDLDNDQAGGGTDTGTTNNSALLTSVRGRLDVNLWPVALMRAMQLAPALGGDVNNLCDSGQVHTTSVAAGMHYQYAQCIKDNYTFDGDLTISGGFGDQGLSINTDNFRMETSARPLLLSGSMQFYADGSIRKETTSIVGSGIDVQIAEGRVTLDALQATWTINGRNHTYHFVADGTGHDTLGGRYQTEVDWAWVSGASPTAGRLAARHANGVKFLIDSESGNVGVNVQLVHHLSGGSVVSEVLPWADMKASF